MKKKEHKFTTTTKKNRRMLKIQEVSKIEKIKNWSSSTTIESDEEELAAEEISRTASQHIWVHCFATSIATGFFSTEELPR
jgi:uncharacterized membrane protein YjjP (DUF1212 family)